MIWDPRETHWNCGFTDRCSVEIYSDGGLFNTSIATVLDPSNIKVFPVYLDSGITVDFEIHKLKSMWDRV